jgi:hypothetical protein
MHTSGNRHADPLKPIFRRLPEEVLPETFRSGTMEKILREAVRIKKRNERLMLAAVVAASLVMAGLGMAVFVYLKVPGWSFSFRMPDVASCLSLPFYIHIGTLSLILLFTDYRIRKAYDRKHKDPSSPGDVHSL